MNRVEAEKYLQQFQAVADAITNGIEIPPIDGIIYTTILLVQRRLTNLEELLKAFDYLKAWEDASLKLTTAQSYTITTPSGTRFVNRADLSEIKDQINYWRDRINQLDWEKDNSGLSYATAYGTSV